MIVNTETNYLLRSFMRSRIVRIMKNKKEIFVKNNLALLIARADTNPNALELATGVPQPTIHRILSGESKDPRTSTIQPLADYFGVDASDLRHRNFAIEGIQRSMQNVMHAPIGTRKIPLVSYVQAGEWTETVDSYHPGDAASWIFTDQELSVSAFALEIKGDSMLPEFKPGDRVIIDPAVRPNPGDFVVAKNGDHEATFKKYRPRGVNEHGDQVIELVPLNPDFPSIRSDTSPLTIIGTMMEHHKYRKK